jgi:hypothetical protein
LIGVISLGKGILASFALRRINQFGWSAACEGLEKYQRS